MLSPSASVLPPCQAVKNGIRELISSGAYTKEKFYTARIVPSGELPKGLRLRLSSKDGRVRRAALKECEDLVMKTVLEQLQVGGREGGGGYLSCLLCSFLLM